MAGPADGDFVHDLNAQTAQLHNVPGTLVTLGIADVAAFYTSCIRDDPILSRLVIRNSTFGGLKANMASPSLPVQVYLITFGRYLRAQVADINHSHVLAATMGEMMGPHVDDAVHYDMNTSNDRIMQAVRTLLGSARLPEVCAHNAAAYAGFLNDNAATPWIQHAPAAWPDADGIAALGPNGLAVLLYYLSTVAGDFSQNLSLLVILNSHVAFLKQGNVTPAFMKKITDGVMTDLGVGLALDANAMKVFHRRYCSNITENNAPTLIAHWDRMVPEVAMRLRLTIEQAAGSGLTAFISIGRAIRAFPDFGWDRINKVLRDDVVAFGLAVTAVNGNPYYGYRRDLGPAKSTNFKNLAWVAKELLIKARGETGLAKYKGWVRSPKSQGTLVDMITDYINQRDDEVDPGDQDNIDQTQALVTSVGNAANMDIFEL